jgi:hypothetical protein
MRASLNDIEQIEEYIFENKQGEEAVLFEARLILQPELKERIVWQKKTYAVIREYSRIQLKKEIENTHRRLFHEPEHKSFRRKIENIFSGII